MKSEQSGIRITAALRLTGAAVTALVLFCTPLEAKAPDAGARANWQALSAEINKDQPDVAVLKAMTNKAVYLRGELKEHSKAGLRIDADSGVTCIVLNPMRLDTRDREEVVVAVTGRVYSVDLLRRTVNVKASSVEIVS